MSERSDYPTGALCWVDTLAPDPHAAADFYGQLFGWRFDDPVPMPAPLRGDYLAARRDRRLVCGIGQGPDASPAALWTTYVRVDGIDDALTRVTDSGGTLLMGPLDARREGRLAVITDPTGV